MRDYGMKSITIAVDAGVKFESEFKILFMQMFVLFGLFFVGVFF